MLRKNGKIKIGDEVIVVLNGGVKRLKIVDMPKGDPKKGIISYLSPIAQAILGHGYPERIKVKLPNGGTIDCELIRPVLN